jgi:ABC-2 type transport system permease protein
MSSAVAQPGLIDISASRRTPFTRLVALEFRKSYDTRSSFWLLASMGIVTVIVYTIMLIIAGVNENAHFAYGDFVGGAAFPTSILLPVLAILLVTSEWSQRTAMTTFSLEPHRARVIAAKLVVGLGWTFLVAAFATVVGAGANGLSGLITGTANWDYGPTGLFAFLITQSLAMLGGFALATLLLNSPAAIVAFFAYKWVVPILFGVAGVYIGWFEKVAAWIEFQNAQGPIWDWELDSGQEWAHLLTSGAFWLALPLALGLWRVLHAEVK